MRSRDGGSPLAESPEEQRRSIEAVALDMAPAFIAATQASVRSRVVHDKFHSPNISTKRWTRCVGRNTKNFCQRDETLKSTRQLWLFNPMNFSDEQAADFEQLKFSGLKVARAWAIKELFSKVWTYCYEGAARKFFKIGSGGPPAANSSPSSGGQNDQTHLENILTYLRHPITNAVTEGLNSKIQCIKSNARASVPSKTAAPESFSSAENPAFTHYETEERK